MSLKTILGAIAVVALSVAPALAQGGGGNGAPSGNHYNLNLSGKVNCPTNNFDGSNRHTIMVLLNYNDASPTNPTTSPTLDRRNKIFLQPGAFQVIDGNACDTGGALFQLPANGNCNVAGTECEGQIYTVWARAVGKPGGRATLTTCRVDGAGEYQCSTENTLNVLDRSNGGKSKFENVTRELTTLCLDTDASGTCDTRLALFAGAGYQYYWDYDNFGIRLAQLRFYPNP